MFESETTLENPTNALLSLWIEPWAVELSLAPAQEVRLVGRSTTAGELEVTREQRRIVVYGWPGSTLEVYSGETPILDLTVPVPAIPNGMSCREFVDFLFPPAAPTSR